MNYTREITTLLMIVALGLMALVAIFAVAYQLDYSEYECTDAQEDIEVHIGQRVYSPSERLYGAVDSLRADCSVLGIHIDNSRVSMQGIFDYVEVKPNKTYLEIHEFENYPSPTLKSYDLHWEGWFENREIDALDDIEIAEYCEETYGNDTFRDRYSCWTKQENYTTVEYINHPVNADIMTVWKLQHVIDNPMNYGSTKMIIEPNQAIVVYTTIDYTYLSGWMNHYGLEYDNRTLSETSFIDIKLNVPFMSGYCATYGYTWYDGNACYRLSNVDESSKLPQDPCANPKSEAVINTCLGIMGAQHE